MYKPIDTPCCTLDYYRADIRCMYILHIHVYCSCTLNMLDLTRDRPLACSSVLCVWSCVRLDNSQVRYKRHHLTLSGRDDHEASISASTFVPALPSSPAFFQLHIDNIIATVGPGANTGHSLKGKLGKKNLSAQSFYPTLTKWSFKRQF